jgi:hypothetical protein
MGWYFKYGASRADVIRKLTAPQKNEETGWERKPLKFSTAGNVLWTVEEITAATDGSKSRIIGCYLLQRSQEGWGYKPMTEEDGPVYYTCPLSYLEIAEELDPKWREHVREYWKKRRQRQQERRLRRG